MQVKVEDAGPCRKKMLIEMPAEEVSDEYASVLSAFSRGARIPGFRPGKAPRALVEKRFGKQAAEEVRDRLIPRGYRDALKQESIAPVAVLGVQDVHFAVGEPMTFSVTLDLPPEFDLPDYKGISLKGEPPAVTAEDVDEAIGRLLDARVRYVDVADRPVGKDDLVQIDYEGTCEGTAIAELAPDAAGLGAGEDFWVHAGEHAFLPGFADGLTGLSVGERGQVIVEFPDDFREGAVAGKKATYFVQVKAIRTQERPPLDAAFLETLGVESEADLRKRVEEDLLKAAESRERSRLKSEIVKWLLARTEMELPASVVEEETRNTIYDIVRQNTARGMSEDEIESHKEELFAMAGRTANEKVKVRYLLHRIASEEGISVTPEDVQGRIQAMAEGYGVPVEEFRAQLEKKHMTEEVEDQLRDERTLDFLLEEAEVTR